MTGGAPRVSIGMPVYNCERYVREAIDSVLAQTYRDFELIICDNASTDATAEICEGYAARDERVRFYRNPLNVGASKNFNRVFQLARGEYFKWVAADDVCELRFLERCVEALDGHPEAILAYPRAKAIDEHGEVFPDFQRGQHMNWEKDGPGRFRQLVDEMPWLMVYIFGLIRSDALRETRLLGTHLGADCNLLAELALIGQFHEVPEHLSLIRVHPGSSTWYSWSNKERSEFFDPANRKGRIGLLLFTKRRYAEYFVSVLRSRLSPRAKAGLVAHNALRPLKRLRWPSPVARRREAGS